jgi:SNF2 family DNA or RNA helicase
VRWLLVSKFPHSGVVINDIIVGLNLTMASKVIMIDPWWNSASEQQAFCRVFRIGQREETFMSRLCVKNTVDEKLIEMQDRKDKEIASIMEDDGEKMKK